MAKQPKRTTLKNSLIGLLALIFSLGLGYASLTGQLVVSDDSQDNGADLVEHSQDSGATADNADQGGGSDSCAAEHTYTFRNSKRLQEHYEKHGIEMGFDSPEAYEAAASAVVENPNALYKTEKEDGDGVYYLEDTNEFVILSTDGHLRTYFSPNDGIDYFNRQ